MVRGAFARFDHDHYFEANGTRTIMREVFDFNAPMGLVGRVAERLFLERYMRDLLANRRAVVKTVAESSAWRCYIEDE